MLDLIEFVSRNDQLPASAAYSLNRVLATASDDGMYRLIREHPKIALQNVTPPS